MAGTKARSARGVVVDFDILAIKAKLASAPKPIKVKEREDYIAQKSRRRRSKKPEEKKETEKAENKTESAEETTEEEEEVKE